MTQRELADLFRRMHLESPLLVLPNAWDVASAKVFAALPGCRALATSSAALARSLGWEDGEQAPVEEMVRVAGRIAAAVGVPVTADLEAGYGDPVGTARAAWDAGVVGMNFEDSSAHRMATTEQQVERIAAIREAVPALVLNARVDVFVNGSQDVQEAVERGNAYLRAGADCVYPILCPTASIAELAGGIDGPVNVLAGRDVPGPDELQALGVARLTWGGSLAATAYAEAARVVETALSDG
jgi:2-methylisocitrate lyase-like PEP mutase family enzyme